MIPILLKDSRIALVDDVDADLVEGVTWSLSKDYLARSVIKDGKSVGLKLHRLVLERKLGRPIKEGLVTDHINGNRCDNRRENLREVTYWENTMNGLMLSNKANNSSGHRGVVYDKNPRMIKKWKVMLHHEGKAIYLGHFDTIDQAAAAYQAGVTRYKVEGHPLPPLGKNGFYNAI